MPGQVEEQSLGLAAFLAGQRFVQRGPDGVARLRRRDDAFSAGKSHAGLKGGQLRHGARFDQSLVIQLADQRAGAVIAQASGVNRRRHEVVAQGVLLHQRGQPGSVAKIIRIVATGQRRAAGRLHRHQPHRLAAGLVGQEGEGHAAKVGAAAARGKHHVRVVFGQGKLLDCLQANHRLMQQHMVEHRAQAIGGVFAAGGFFHCFGNRQAQRAGVVGVSLQRGAAGGGVQAGAGQHFGAPGLHHRAAERLLLVADLDHEHPHINAKGLAGKRQRAAPLASAGFGGHAANAGFAVVISLGDGRIELVAAGRAAAFVFVINARRGAQRGFQPAGAHQRGGPPQLIQLAHRLGNGNPALAGDFLLDDGVGKDGRQRVRPDGLAIRPQHRRGRAGQVGDNVVPVSGNISLGQDEAGGGHDALLG